MKSDAVREHPAPGLRAAATACLVLAAALAPAARAQGEPAGFSPGPAETARIEALAREAATQAAGAEATGLRIEVKVGRLDPRLRLAACEQVEPYLPAGAPAWGATRVGLRCVRGTRPWNVSLPVTVGVFAPSTVLVASLPAGTVLAPGQLARAEVDLAAGTGAPVRDPALAAGRTLVRPLPAGAGLRQTDLKARQFFAAGETVRVVAGGPGWQVESEGEAINAGIEGQIARVRTGNGRVLNARPVGDREVELLL